MPTHSSLKVLQTRRDILREIHLLSLGDLMFSIEKNQLLILPVSRRKPLMRKFENLGGLINGFFTC
jgi:hypothetical protein